MISPVTYLAIIFVAPPQIVGSDSDGFYPTHGILQFLLRPGSPVILAWKFFIRSSRGEMVADGASNETKAMLGGATGLVNRGAGSSSRYPACVRAPGACLLARKRRTCIFRFAKVDAQ